jgi:alanyl-tRNA synthetase
MKSDELRQKFLSFFEKRGHKVIPSASLIPTPEVELSGTQKVLFTTAGMHPLIPYLLGQKHPEGKRLVNVQKCLRTDDIDEIGDSVHCTFFEMLGNWSLGDPASPDGIGQGGYWKKEAIAYSWEFLTGELGLLKERIYVSVFEGDRSAPFDKESFDAWREIGIPPERIFKYPKKDNWWGPVGETGPCGPDTEMFYDVVGGDLKGEEPSTNSERFIEIWNDVFMEYDKKEDGTYKPLAQKNVDTGMGLERMLAVLQGKKNIYETDLFAEAMSRLMEKSTTRDIGYARKIADHSRAIVFLIASDVPILGQDPRGSVLNNLLNNSFAYLRHLGINHSYLSYIAETFIDIYQSVYPEIKEKKGWILNQISQQEEQNIRELLQKTAIEKTKMESVVKNPEPEQLKKIYVSTASVVSGEELSPDDIFKIKTGGPTLSEVVGTVSAQYKQSLGIPVEDSIKVAEKVFVEVKPKEKFNEKELLKGYEDMMRLHSKRSKIEGKKKFAGGLGGKSPKIVAGHTATHLLQAALRQILGNHVQQTGSNITEERIRFDFSHSEKLTDQEIKKIEDLINKKIDENLPVQKELMTPQDAKKSGAIGLFDEKYTSQVSVYSVGDSSAGLGKIFSKEICGGPHVGSTKEIGHLKIVKEEGLGSGKRRIYAKLD